jgi:hypothetical protein
MGYYVGQLWALRLLRPPYPDADDILVFLLLARRLHTSVPFASIDNLCDSLWLWWFLLLSLATRGVLWTVETITRVMQISLCSWNSDGRSRLYRSGMKAGSQCPSVPKDMLRTLFHLFCQPYTPLSFLRFWSPVERFRAGWLAGEAEISRHFIRKLLAWSYELSWIALEADFLRLFRRPSA